MCYLRWISYTLRKKQVQKLQGVIINPYYELCKIIDGGWRYENKAGCKSVPAKLGIRAGCGAAYCGRTCIHIRCCQTICKTDLRRCRILLSFENNTLITPVAKIVYRCWPAYIVSKTEIQAVKKIMRTIYVYTSVHNMRLRIRHVFPAWQVRKWCKGRKLSVTRRLFFIEIQLLDFEDVLFAMDFLHFT